MPEALSIDPCNLCPRLCHARRNAGKRGACGADATMRIARAALHFWEEPPVSGETGSGTVFFSGCPLHCVYCQNYHIAGGAVGPEVDVAHLARICLDLEAQGAVNVNFVTPTHHALQIREAVAIARSAGLDVPIVWNTSGYERVEAIRALEGTVDVYLADFKYVDSELAKRYSHVPDYPDVALGAIEEMASQVGAPRFDAAGSLLKRGVVVRHLLLPDALGQSKEALRVLWERLGDRVLYSIMNQYTPVITGTARKRFPELTSPVSSEEYEELLDFADELGIEDYYWQDGPAAAESFIPSWNGEGVLE